MKQQGFTLIELSIVLAITALLFILGSSSYSHIVDKFNYQRDRAAIYMLLQSTRQAAIDNLTAAILCPSIDQILCINDWTNPLMIFIDTNNNRKHEPEEQLIYQYNEFMSTEVSITYPNKQIRFNSQGMVGNYNGTLSYCFKDYILGIIISRPGRIRFARDLDGDHIPDVNYNTPITCE